MKKTLVLTIDMQGAKDWQIKALQHQLSDWIEANKALLPIEDIIILPTPGDTRLYWIEGKLDDPKDLKALEEVRDRLKPVLEVALDIKIDKKGLFIDPIKRRINRKQRICLPQ